MNETTMEPEGLDDPALLAEIEAEFAELTREIQRISAMPANVGPRKSELLEALRQSWRDRLISRGVDKPEWRQRLDETIGRAVDRLLEDGIVENADGSLGFALRGDTLQNEGGPLLRGLLDGLSNMLTEKFPPPDAAAAPSPGAPPPNPLQGLLGGLGQMLAGALKTAVSQVGTQGFGAAKIPTDAGNVQVVVTPAEQVKGTAKSGESVDVGAVDFHTEQDIKTSFEFDTRSKTDGAGAADASGSAAGAGAAGAGVAGNVFFQQLFANLGQVVRQAVTPQSGAQPSQPAGPPSPLGGLGQLFLGAIQKAFTPPPQAASNPQSQPVEGASQDTTADTVTASSPTQEAEPAGEVTPPPSEEPAQTDAVAEELRIKIPQSNAKGAPGDGTAPALNVDLAGLLRQILGNIKPPGT